MRTPLGTRSRRIGSWYFGWNIVAASTITTLLTVGMRMGIGPFMLPMARDLGFNRSLLSGIVAIGMLCYGIAMPIAGYLVARLGTRRVLLIGTAIVVASSIWSVAARSPLSFCLAYGVSLSLGLGLTSPVALTPVISRWFVRKRGMALFFLSTGSMAGIAIMTPLFTMSIGAVGWQHTIVLYAALFAILNIPISMFVMKDNAPPGADQLEDTQRATQRIAPSPAAPTMTIRQALGTACFWQIAMGLFACGFSMNLLGTHGVPMLMDHGFGAAESSMGIGLIGLVAIFSTLLLGQISDRIERRNILSTIYFVRGIGFFALVAVDAHWELYAAAAIGGIVWAGSIAMSSAILVDKYGTRLVGVLYGWTYLGHQIGAMLSSWFGGWGYETFGSHWPAFGGAGLLLLAAAAISNRLPSRAILTPAGGMQSGSTRGI